MYYICILAGSIVFTRYLDCTGNYLAMSIQYGKAYTLNKNKLIKLPDWRKKTHNYQDIGTISSFCLNKTHLSCTFCRQPIHTAGITATITLSNAH